jgi:hypothetical protein
MVQPCKDIATPRSAQNHGVIHFNRGRGALGFESFAFRCQISASLTRSRSFCSSDIRVTRSSTLGTGGRSGLLLGVARRFRPIKVLTRSSGLAPLNLALPRLDKSIQDTGPEKPVLWPQNSRSVLAAQRQLLSACAFVRFLMARILFEWTGFLRLMTETNLGAASPLRVAATRSRSNQTSIYFLR